jgi:hypothetical protein
MCGLNEANSYFVSTHNGILRKIVEQQNGEGRRQKQSLIFFTDVYLWCGNIFKSVNRNSNKKPSTQINCDY